jgi:hypothetical protein
VPVEKKGFLIDRSYLSTFATNRIDGLMRHKQAKAEYAKRTDPSSRKRKTRIRKAGLSTHSPCVCFNPSNFPFLLTRQYAWHMVPHKSSVEISETALIVGPRGPETVFLALK